MKKSILLSILGFAIVHFSFTNKVLFYSGLGMFVTNEYKSQNIVPYLDIPNHTYVWLITNSPGNTPQTAINLTRMSYDSIFFRQKYFVFDTLNLVPSTTIDGKLLWIKSSGIAAVTSFSAVQFPYSQLTGTPSIPQTLTLTGVGINTITGTSPNLTVSATEADPLFSTKFSSKTTTDLSEGSNLYYTASRFNTGFSNKFTTDLSEGTNLYYTTSRFNSAFSGKSTSDLSEGSNLYYTSVRFNSDFLGKSTTDLIEGTNLYFSTARTRTTVSAGTGINYVSGTGVITNSLPDQTVFITASNPSVTISGSYPSFTVGNAAPDQVVNLTAGNNDISISGTYPNFTITPYTPTTFTVSRAINSSTFQISTTRHADAIYNVGISCTASIGSNASGLIQLQYSIDGGSTWLNASRIKNSNTVTLAIALASVNDQEVVIVMLNIPAGARLRIVPTTSGTTTITSILGFETF